MRTLKILLLVIAPIILCGFFWSSARGLAIRVAELEAQVEELSAILEFVHVETGNINGLTGPHWIIEGANLHVRSGAGQTDEFCEIGAPDFPNCENLTGLGNLIVGYNERTRTGPPIPREIRTGSHNLVIGDRHSYTSVAGLVVGRSNKVTGSHASVTGGKDNEASGYFSSVSGGHLNKTDGVAASVSGGDGRDAPDDFNWAAGSLLESN